MSSEPEQIKPPLSSEEKAAHAVRRREETQSELLATFARLATANELWNRAATWACVGALAVVVVVVCFYEFAS